VITGNSVNVSSTDGSQNILGDKAWASMLLYGLQ
jgi:hypothetical protein